MEDTKIVELYWQRSEDAIPETAAKFGPYCHTIAYNILSDTQDTEECVNDTWLGAWNSMPSNRPKVLAPYLAKLTRWLSLTRLREQNALRDDAAHGLRKVYQTGAAPQQGADADRHKVFKRRSLQQGKGGDNSIRKGKEGFEAIHIVLSGRRRAERNRII